jgi:transposase
MPRIRSDDDQTSTPDPCPGFQGKSGTGGDQADAAPAVDIKTLHAKIGELTLENDFLSGALSKADLLSAKR